MAPTTVNAAMSIDQCCHSGRAANICLHLLTFPPFIQTWSHLPPGFSMCVFVFVAMRRVFSISVQRYLLFAEILSSIYWLRKQIAETDWKVKCRRMPFIFKSGFGIIKLGWDWFCKDLKCCRLFFFKESFPYFQTEQKCNFNSYLNYKTDLWQFNCHYPMNEGIFIHLKTTWEFKFRAKKISTVVWSPLYYLSNIFFWESLGIFV